MKMPSDSKSTLRGFREFIGKFMDAEHFGDYHNPRGTVLLNYGDLKGDENGYGR